MSSAAALSDAAVFKPVLEFQAKFQHVTNDQPEVPCRDAVSLFQFSAQH
jgi:hypothetical protein